jgi:hypothetical protein
MSLAIATGWWIGWAVGAVVVVIAATVIITIIVLALRISRQARQIEAAIDGARENTTPLFDVTKTNLALDQITRHLRSLREGLASE